MEGLRRFAKRPVHTSLYHPEQMTRVLVQLISFPVSCVHTCVTGHVQSIIPRPTDNRNLADDAIRVTSAVVTKGS